MPESQQKNIPFYISWTAPEFIRYEKSHGWFIAIGIFGFLLVIVALFMKNYLFVLIIVLATFLIYIQGARHPRKIKFVISDHGIEIDEKEYLWSEFKSFWIFEEPDKILSLLTKKITQPHLPIPLGDQQTEDIKKILIRFIPERKQEETLSDVIARKMKF